MKLFLITLYLAFTPLQAQQIDYNTKKGFVANGYDVVSYFIGSPLVGDKKLTAEFDGVSYKFSSQKNLETFKETPPKYVPQYGGYCAYAIGAKSDKVSINPKTFLIENGKLYLFYNAWGTNTLKLWQQDLKGLKQKADKNWESIKLIN